MTMMLSMYVTRAKMASSLQLEDDLDMMTTVDDYCSVVR
jgi:hypothetical protein